MTRPPHWNRYRDHLCHCESIGLTLDVSRMRFSESFLNEMAEPMGGALDAMKSLESGAIANPDEQRRVGHYWLRDPALAPEPSVHDDIENTIRDIRRFAEAVHRGEKGPGCGRCFRHVVVVGIGGSALGSQLVCDALSTPTDPITIWFCDNTDPDGFDRVFAGLGDALDRTLTIVVSKSGATKETHNAMLEIAQQFKQRQLPFASSAVAITCPGSDLDLRAQTESWLARFPMWDWVGGRTSVFSAVGLLPAALQGVDIDAFLAGAAQADRLTRTRFVPPPTDGGVHAEDAATEPSSSNPAALLALMWYYAGDGRGKRDMVVLPYKDRLALFGRHLQQLVMESIGKRVDRQGRTVHQGLTVYGNKGTTDQHALVQQLQDGPDDFFVTFISVLRDRAGESMEVEPGVTSGDYLHGFQMGTRESLYEAGRDSITITLDELTPHRLGALIAVFDRAVGLYAELIDVNAYHQPGVEAVKRVAGKIITLQGEVVAYLRLHPGEARTADEVAQAIGHGEEVETVYQILRHLAANPDRHVVIHPATSPTASRFSIDESGASTAN